MTKAAKSEMEAGQVVGSRLCSPETQTLLNNAKGLSVLERHELLKSTEKQMATKKKDLESAILEVSGIDAGALLPLPLPVSPPPTHPIPSHKPIHPPILPPTRGHPCVV